MSAALTDTASAHPPYEYQAQVITDEGGRTLNLFKSYVDGIIANDPVKLVVRDADDRTIAETQYTRNVAILCRRAAACLVFEYETFVSVVPERIWRLEGGRLREVRSTSLVALGIVAPLWDDAYSYSLAFLTFIVPAMGVWLFWSGWQSRPTDGRMVLMVVASIAGVLYGGFWILMTASQSALSLPLAIAVCLAGTATIALAGVTARRVGIPSKVLLRAARVAAVIICGLAAAEVIFLSWHVVRMIAYSNSLSFDEPPVDAPLEKVRLTRAAGVPTEVFATLVPDVWPADVVNMDLFDGFDPWMTREAAEQRVGPPSGRWEDPIYKQKAIYYDRPAGRVSVFRRGASAWHVVGHPSACTPDTIMRDSRLRDQIVKWLPQDDALQVHFSRKDASGLTVFLNRRACWHLLLTGQR